MITNMTKDIVNESLTVLRGLLALEGAVSNNLEVSGDVHQTIISEPVERSVDIRDNTTAAQLVGQAWTDRIFAVRVKQHPGRDTFFKHCYADDDGQRIVKYQIGLSPFDVACYLEEAARRGLSKNIDSRPCGQHDILVRVVVPGGLRGIRRDALLTRTKRGRLETPVYAPGGIIPRYNLFLTLSDESADLLDKFITDSDSDVTGWKLLESHGEVVILEPVHQKRKDGAAVSENS